MPPQPPQPSPLIRPTETFPRSRGATQADEPTRLDVRRPFEVGEPTVVTPARPQVRVSPIAAHTVGAAAATPPHGMPELPIVATINRILDERDEREHRRAGRPPVRSTRSIREEAAQRAAAKLRHERHLERLETARAYLLLFIIFCLAVIVVGAGVVGFGILAGWYEWVPKRV